MSWSYRCPKCTTYLNPGRCVIMTIAHDDTRILIGMHPQPGKYEVALPPQVVVEDGTPWDFYCPMCQENLAAPDTDNLCELELLVDDESLRVLFSRVAGEHATFVLHEDTVREKHGEDAARYNPIKGTGLAARS